MASAPTRRSAEERRREIVEIAIRHFAQNGYNGTSTDQVAREAGISQPYLFRLFGTKRELFLACNAAMHDRIAATFAEAAARPPAGGAHEGDGRRLQRPARRPQRAAVPDAELRRLRRPGDPGARARGLRHAGAPGAGGDRRLPGRPVVVLLPRDAAQRDRRAPARGARAGRGVGGAAGSTRTRCSPTRTDARPPGRPDLPPAPALPVGLAGGGARRRLLRRPGVRAARLERRLRRPELGGAAGVARHRPRDEEQRGAGPRRAGAARRAGRLGGRPAQARPRRGRAEGPGHEAHPLRARRRPQRSSRRTGARPTSPPRSPRTAAACSTRVRPRLERDPRRDDRRQRHRPRPGRRPGVGGHRARRAARVPDPLPAVAVRVPQRRRGAAPARGRRRHDHALVPRDAVRQRHDRADVDLRAEPHHRARAGPRDRLLAVRRLALPRGARARARHRRGAARDDDHRGPDRAVLLGHRRGGARRRCSCSRCASSTRWASAGSCAR